MPFLTQVRQVLQQDVREARWALIAFVATLGYAVVQGRQLLEPLPIVNDTFSVPTGWSAAAAVVAPMVTFLLAGFVALNFAPLVGTSGRPNQAWRTLPIEPNAVWTARLLWVLTSFTLALAVAWLVLLPLPIAAAARLDIATSVAINTGAIMLAGAVLASVAASVRSLLSWMLITPVLVFVVPLLDLFGFGPGIDWTLLTVFPAHVVGLALVTATTLWALLRAHRVGWFGRVGAGAVAMLLLAANVRRAPAPDHPDVSASLPTLVAVEAVTASLNRFSGTSTITRMSSDASASPTPMRSRAAATEEPPSHYTLRLDARLSSLGSTDRVVLRPRAATLRSEDTDWRFSTVSSDVVVAPGSPSLGEPLRWLNAPTAGIPTAFASAERRQSEVASLTNATASFTVDVSRQQPVVLAELPLDGSPAAGPWSRFMRAQLTAPNDSTHIVHVSLKRLGGVHARGTEDEAGASEYTYALRHRERGEALHLTSSRRFTSSALGWALSPSLIDAVHAGLLPAGTTAVTMRDVADAAWLRGATLVVIGWRTVERGAITLDAPLSTPIAVR